jgi:acetyltransferase-like isoleucine patch superfamily enzyme
VEYPPATFFTGPWNSQVAGDCMKKKNIFINRDAVVESPHIGDGTRIWRNVHVMPGAIIGKNCNICEGCYIENHVRIGNDVTIKNNVSVWDNITIEDDVFIGPAAVFTNDYIPRAQNKKGPEDLDGILIKHGATIGANATIVCRTVIHEYAFIGAGSVVTKDVPPSHLVYGNPAKFKELICCCARLIPKDKTRHVCTCGRKYKIYGKSVQEVF